MYTLSVWSCSIYRSVCFRLLRIRVLFSWLQTSSWHLLQVIRLNVSEAFCRRYHHSKGSLRRSCIRHPANTHGFGVSMHLSDATESSWVGCAAFLNIVLVYSDVVGFEWGAYHWDICAPSTVGSIDVLWSRKRVIISCNSLESFLFGFTFFENFALMPSAVAGFKYLAYHYWDVHVLSIVQTLWCTMMLVERSFSFRVTCRLWRWSSMPGAFSHPPRRISILHSMQYHQHGASSFQQTIQPSYTLPITSATKPRLRAHPAGKVGFARKFSLCS